MAGSFYFATKWVGESALIGAFQGVGHAGDVVFLLGAGQVGVHVVDGSHGGLAIGSGPPQPLNVWIDEAALKVYLNSTDPRVSKTASIESATIALLRSKGFWSPSEQVEQSAGEQMTKRPLNQCPSCGHSWQPRGHDVSRRCPECNNPFVEIALPPPAAAAGSTCLGCCVGVVLIVMFLLCLISALGRRDQQNAKQPVNPAPVASPPKPPEKVIVLIALDPEAFEAGQVGRFGEGDASLRFRVFAIIDENTMILRYGSTPLFVAKGQKTAGIMEGQAITLPGIWRVGETTAIGGKDCRVVELTE